MSSVPLELKPDLRNFQPRRNKYPAPSAGIFDSPLVSLCINEKWASFVSGVLEVLETGQYWEGDEQAWQEAEQEVLKLQAILLGATGIATCSGNIPDSGQVCNTYAPNSNIIAYAPNDPFQTPDFTPSGYYSPPWESYDNLLSQLAGGQAGDAIFSVLAVKPDVSTLGFPISFFVTNIIQAIGFLSSGFPRFEIRTTGEGTATLKLLALPFGGQAWISVDNDLKQIVDTFTVTPASVTEINDWIELILGTLATDDSLIEERIIELDITGNGQHQIDVTFVPMVGADGNVGWGGGLREVVLCNEQFQGVSNQMPQFRVNQENFNVEWKPTELHTEWAGIGQVIYPIHMQTEVDEMTQIPKIQWTLQPIPIGGGASPFDSWLDLTDILSGQDAETPQFRVDSGWVQWKLPSESEWTNLFEIPQDGMDGIDGTNITQVNVTTLGAGSQATASIDGTTLNLGIPQGEDGTSPPIPDFEWVGHTVRIDADGDGIYETTSPTLKGDTADCGCDDQLPTDQTESDANRCGKAVGLVDFVWEIYSEIRTQAEAVVSIADTVSSVIGAFPVLGWAYEGVYSAVSDVIQLGSFTLLDTQDTLANREALQQAWYCIFDESDQLNDSQYNAIKSAITATLPSPLGEAMLGAFISLSRGEMNKRAWLYAKDGGNCALFNCGGVSSDWCYEFDLSLGIQGWSLHDTGDSGNPNSGSYVTDCCYVSESYSWGHSLLIEIAFAAPITAIEVQHSHNGSGFQSFQAHADNFNQAFRREIPFISGQTSKVNFEDEWQINNKLILECYADNTHGSYQVFSIKIWGTTANPFGEDNCS